MDGKGSVVTSGMGHLLRERLRVERDLIGTSHPFVVTRMVIRRGSEVQELRPVREMPIPQSVQPWSLFGWFRKGLQVAEGSSILKLGRE